MKSTGILNTFKRLILRIKLCKYVISGVFIFLLTVVLCLIRKNGQSHKSDFVLSNAYKTYYHEDYKTKYEKVDINDNNLLKLWDFQEELIFEQNINIWNQPLRMWNPHKEILIFIHIGKSAGNSFSQALTHSILKKNRCKMRCLSKLVHLNKNQPNCREIKPILCGIHFDWTVAKKVESLGYQVAPIVILRNPVQRIISHFYFLQNKSWSKGKKYRKQTLSEFFNDTESMMESYHLWNDGQVMLKVIQYQYIHSGYFQHFT